MEAQRSSEGPAARDDRLTLTDARDYFAHLVLRRALVEWRVVVLQGQEQWRGEAIKRLRVESRRPASRNKEPVHRRPAPYFQCRLLRFSRSTPHYHAVVDSSEHQPTPLPPSAASPLAVSFRALCGDLRGVNGGLKTTSPPLAPPRPTGSTRARRL